MKWIAAFLAVLVLAMPLVIADTQAGANGQTPANAQTNVGITPDSPFYGIKIFFDELRYFFTFDSHAKADLAMNLADNRLAEVQQMIVQNNMAAAQVAEQEDERALVKVSESVKSLPNDQQSANQVAEIETKLAQHQETVRQMFGNLDVTIKAKGDITAEQQSTINAVINSLANQTGDVKIKVDEKKSNLQINIKTGHNETTEKETEKEIKESDKEKDGDSEINDEGEHGAANKQHDAQARIDAAIQAIANASAALNTTNNNSTNIADAQYLIAQARIHLSNAQSAFSNGKFGEAFGQATAAESQANNALRILNRPPGVVLGQISGMKFDDTNGNGVRDAGETGLAGWTIYIDANNNGTLDTGEISVVTNATGGYQFTGLAEGGYNIREVQQAGWTRTTTNPSTVVIDNSTKIVTGINFGNFRLGKISGVEFNDTNNNSVQDAGEAGLSNWTINLAGPVNATAVTDTNGTFSFTGLTAGTYTVTEVAQANWTLTTPLPSPITIQSGSNVQNVLFGNLHV